MGDAEYWASVFRSCVHTIASDRCRTNAAKELILSELEKLGGLPEPVTQDERSFRLEEIKTRIHAIMSADAQIADRRNVFGVDAVKLYEVCQLVREYLDRPYETNGPISALHSRSRKLMERIGRVLLQDC